MLIALPLFFSLKSFTGFSLMGEKLAGRFDMDFLFEFLKYKSGATSAIIGLIILTFILYWIFSLFLSGGAFSLFSVGRQYDASLFWSGCAQNFGRFFRLVLYALPIFAILFSLQFLETGFRRLFFGSDPYENIIYWGEWIKVGLRYLGILLFGLVFDYARIYTVLSGERRMRHSIWRGIRFAFKNIGYTFGLTFILFFAGAFILVVYNLIADRLSAPSALIIFTLFLLQQIYMVFRMVLRLTLFSSETVLYRTAALKSD